MARFELVPLSFDWFVKNIYRYLAREEFQEFQEALEVSYVDVLDPSKRRLFGNKLCDHSSIFFEIARAKGGAFFPEKVYRKDVNFYNRAPHWIPRVDDIILHRPMCYSLKLRFDALRQTIIPYIFDTRLNGKDAIVIGNLGSGLGRDVHQPVLRSDGFVRRVVNIDMDKDAISYGRKEVPKEIADKVVFYRGNFLKGNPEGEPYDFCLLIGIICPLTNESAIKLLRLVYEQVAPGGAIAVSSPSHKMHSDDPLCRINIQLAAEWALNCRREDDLAHILTQAGFKKVEILYELSGYNLIAVGSKE